MATKWSHPRFVKAQYDTQQATKVTSSNAAGTYVSSAYGDVTWVKSS